jgi:hypothetical protein
MFVINNYVTIVKRFITLAPVFPEFSPLIFLTCSFSAPVAVYIEDIE